MDVLKDKVCVVTGGSSGIGAAIVRAFVSAGASVHFSYLTKEKPAKAIASQFGIEPPIQMDVRNRSSIRNMIKTIVEQRGAIDVWVNNAGVNHPADFDKQTEEEWHEVLDVNLTGVWRCCQEITPFLRSGSSIINIGSLSGEYGGPRTPSYAAAKSGVMALTHCFARFLGSQNIRVNCISPGVIGSEFTERTMSPDVRRLLDSMLLLKRCGDVDEVASLAVYLASDGASYITGQTLSVNGGAWVR